MNFKQNFQIKPIKLRFVPNFKLCKVIYNLQQAKFSRMVVDGKQRKILEKKNVKGYGDIVTVYQIANDDDCDNTDPLNEFDYAVFSACLSYFDKGDSCISLGIIYRAMTGKTTEGGKGKVPPEIRESILLSLKKLIGTVIEIDDAQVNSAFDYAKPGSKKCSAILPAHFDETLINGKDASVVFFDRISPLMAIAKQRKQILSYSPALLDAPGIRNSFMNIMLKNYVIRRVAEIKIHKNLRKIITFADVFRKCRIDNADRKIKQRAREVIIKFFEHLQAEGFIKSFETVNEKKTLYSVHISLYKSASDNLQQRICHFFIDFNGSEHRRKCHGA